MRGLRAGVSFLAEILHTIGKVRLHAAKVSCFIGRLRGKLTFSVIILNTIEKVGPQVAKVSCFIGPFGGSSGPAPEREHYRGWWPDPLRMQGVGEVFFPGVRGLRAGVPCLGATLHILVAR